MSNSTGATTATCITQGDWSFNSLGQSPCDIASALGRVCIGHQFTVPALPVGAFYIAPSVADANACRCSSVYYSLLSACANCQDRQFLQWSVYDGNCSTVLVSLSVHAPNIFGSQYPSYIDHSFPEAIPEGTVVPHYAYLDVNTTDTFNISLAESAGGAESSPGPTPVSRTATYSPTQTGSKAKSSSDVGPIAGGVIGGVILLALLAGFIFWLFRRKRNKAPPPSQNYGPDTASSAPPMGFNDKNPYTTTPPKLYDPSDPSTYPASHTPPTGYTPPYANVTPNYSGGSQKAAVAYTGRFTGAPEVT